jgi:hypothetical protein
VKVSIALAGVVLSACIGSLLAQSSHAAELNLAVLTCDKYENAVLTGTMPGYDTDPIDTVMWLFGFSVARSGEHIMYGDSCKANPGETLLEAVTTVKSMRHNPMDISQLRCVTFAPRHIALEKSDPQSANTLAMWLYGYSTGLGTRRVLDSTALTKFDAALLSHCDAHPDDSLFDALSSLNPAAPKR